MGRCAVFKSIHQETELCLRIFVTETKEFEYLGLQFFVVDTDGTSTYFDAIDDEVVGIGAHVSGIGIELGNVFGLGRSEGVMHGMPAFAFVIPFEGREVENPQGSEGILVAEVHAGTHFKTEFREGFAGLIGVAGKDEHQISGIGIEGSRPFL